MELGFVETIKRVLFSRTCGGSKGERGEGRGKVGEWGQVSKRRYVLYMFIFGS